MNRLCSSYINYYKHQTTSSAKDLLEEIINFDFNYYWDFVECVQTPSYGSSESIEMNTSGTASESKSYRFGPNPQFWMRNIENAIKNPAKRTVVFLNVMLALNPVCNVPFSIEYPPYDYCINGNWFGDTHSLIGGLDSLNDQLGLFSTPKIFLYLSKDITFLEHAAAKKWNLISSGSEAFFPRIPFRERSIYLNDNMVNWVNGLNFFECPSGTKHFIPIFVQRAGRIVNLLNMSAENYDDEDFWQFDNDVKKCSCGRYYLEFRFVPHKSMAIVGKDDFLYAPEFAELLGGNYLSFQFIQQVNGIINVLYMGDMYSNDKSIICNFLEINGFNDYEFFENKFMFTNKKEKTAAFYRNIYGKSMLTYPYPWRPLKLAL